MTTDLFNLYLTRQVSEEQILIYNDVLHRPKPVRHWANCAPPYGTPDHGPVVIQPGLEPECL